MTEPSLEDLALEYKYRVEGRSGLLPYTLARKATSYPRYCVVPDVHDPARRDSNLCDRCADQVRADLLLIEQRWDMLEDALTPTRRPSNGERPGSSDTGSAAPIDLDVAEARGLASAAVWSVVSQLVQDNPRVVLPVGDGTYALAGALGRWHVEYIASHPSAGFAELAYRDLHAAALAVDKLTFPPAARASLDSHCHQHTDDERGGRVPCSGVLEAVVRADGVKVVECSVDPMHLMPIEKWMQVVGQRSTKKRGVAGRLLARYGG